MPVCRWLLMPVLATALIVTAIVDRGPAQDAARPKTAVVQFASDKETRDVVDADKLISSPNMIIRPNAAQGYGLYVRNDDADDRDVTVQLLDERGAVKYEGKRTVPSGKYGRVTLAPAKAPMAPMAPAAAAPPMPPPPPAPPGIELKASINPKTKVREYAFRLKVTDDNPMRLKKKEAVFDADVLVTMVQVDTYVKVGTPKYSRGDKVGTFEVEVTTSPDFVGPNCPVELVFPPQAVLNETPLEGVYRRTLSGPKQTVRLSATVGLRDKPDAAEMGTVYLNIDGVARARVYRLDFSAAAEGDVVKANDKAMIRLIEEVKRQSPDEFVSMPKDKFPVRVEVDPPASGSLQVRLNRSRTNKFTEPDETLTRESLRHEQIWVDPAGEGGVFGVKSGVSDWVIPLDVRDMRGRYTLQAAIVSADSKDTATFTRPLILDDTPPDDVRVDGLPAKHYRGTPLPIRIFASDSETRITKAAVFFGKPTKEGKLPEGAVLIDAEAPKTAGDPWVAQMPIPMDQKGGPATITAVVTNGVGLTTAKPVQLQLIDPPTGGTIKGLVKLGMFGKGQAGVTVLLKDADGKDKGSTKTDKKGVYTFEDVAPGGYKVSAAMPDAGVGTKGEIAVRVLAGKTTPVGEADIVLTRKP